MTVRGALLAALFGALAATAALAGEPVTLKFATLSTADGPLNTRVLHLWAERVNEAGKGIVQLDVRDGFAIANYDNIYERVLGDVVQVAFTVTGSLAGKFVLANVVNLPMLYDRSDEASVAYWRLYQSGALDSEYTDIVPLYLVTLTNGGFHLVRPAAAPDDIRGFKIVASSKITSEVVADLGGSPISLQQNDMYTALQRKTADGTAGAWTSFPAFKLGEVTSYHIEARIGGAAAMVFMARKIFDALPDAAKKVLIANSGEEQSRIFGKYWMDLDNEVRAQYQTMQGHTIVNLTPAQTAAWRQKLQPIYDEWNSRPGGAATLAKFQQLLAQVKAGR